MAETPNEILRALAHPERLAIAGRLARGNVGATQLAEELSLPIVRVRRHLNRLAATGVARLDDDRRTYRLRRCVPNPARRDQHRTRRYPRRAVRGAVD